MHFLILMNVGHQALEHLRDKALIAGKRLLYHKIESGQLQKPAIQGPHPLKKYLTELSAKILKEKYEEENAAGPLLPLGNHFSYKHSAW